MLFHYWKHGDLSFGLPLTVNNDVVDVGNLYDSHLKLSTDKLQLVLDRPLKDRLSARLTEPAVVLKSFGLWRCDYEKRAEIWLKDETEATRNDALVLIEASQDQSFRPNATPIAIKLDGTGSSIIAESRYVAYAWRGVVALCHLKQHDSLSIVESKLVRRKTLVKLTCLSGGELRKG